MPKFFFATIFPFCRIVTAAPGEVVLLNRWNIESILCSAWSLSIVCAYSFKEKKLNKAMFIKSFILTDFNST